MLCFSVHAQIFNTINTPYNSTQLRFQLIDVILNKCIQQDIIRSIDCDENVWDTGEDKIQWNMSFHDSIAGKESTEIFRLNYIRPKIRIGDVKRRVYVIKSLTSNNQTNCIVKFRKQLLRDTLISCH